MDLYRRDNFMSSISMILFGVLCHLIPDSRDGLLEDLLFKTQEGFIFLENRKYYFLI